MSVEILLLGGLAYLVGSIPTAYLAVRKRHGVDLRKEGTGNIGAMNSYDVTKSRAIFVLVFLLDVLKGFLPVFFAWWYFDGLGLAGSLAMAAVVGGHNYSIFLGFHGGRGLAPAVGASILVEPLFIPIWIIGWGIGMAIRRQVHIGNLVATILAPIFLWFTLPHVHWTAFQFSSTIGHWMTGLVLCLLILSRHIEPILALRGK